MLRIAVFASGNGTNATNIIRYFENSSIARVHIVLSNNKDAKVLKRAKNLKVNTMLFTKEDMYSNNIIVDQLKSQVDFIVLAGFLWRIPITILQAFPNKIINIHPALLPKYGGKGMYGMKVHQAVKDNQEEETGITIHYVNEYYDEGAIIFQKKVEVTSNDTPGQIAEKVHELEYQFFPKVINEIIVKSTKLN